MNKIKLKMVRDNLDDLPAYHLPQGYSYRFYQPGDKKHWTEIEHQCGEFSDKHEASRRFKKEFESYEDEMQRRCIFLTWKQSNCPVGTVTAWYGCWGEELYGRLHFLGIVPEYQGKKLGKPLVNLVMHRLKELGHEKVYLTTDSSKIVAIKIYLDFGFVPSMESEESRRGWDMVFSHLEYPVSEALSGD